jgi:hypothetical protein
MHKRAQEKDKRLNTACENKGSGLSRYTRAYERSATQWEEIMGLGKPGPPPKRSDQRIRRNKDDVPVEKVVSIAPASFHIPELGFEDPHPIVLDFYEALKDSAQSRYYEPSDWQFARVILWQLNEMMKGYKQSGQMMAVITSALSELLVTEGARRRVRMEVEKAQETTKLADVASLFKEQLAK